MEIEHQDVEVCCFKSSHNFNAENFQFFPLIFPFCPFKVMSHETICNDDF